MSEGVLVRGPGAGPLDGGLASGRPAGGISPGGPASRRWPAWRVFAAAFIVGLSGALSPGPLTVATLDQAARVGALAGPVAAASHALLELLMVWVLGLGLSRLLRRGPVAAGVAVGGGAMLLWMSWGMIAGAATAVVPEAAGRLPGGLSGLSGPAVAGIVATLGNPYWFLWWASVGAAQLAWTRRQAMITPLAFWAGHVASDLVWLSALAAAVATGRRFFSDALYRGFLCALGLAIGLLGLYFVASARSLYHGRALPGTAQGDGAGPSPEGPAA